MQAGDIGFSHSSGTIGHGIRVAEWLRFRKGSYWSHTFTLNRRVPGTANDWYVIEARSHGVTDDRKLSEIPGKWQIVSSPLNDFDTPQQLKFLRNQVGERYGFITIGSILITLIAPKFINVMLPGTWICSALAAEGLRAGGWLHNWPDLYQITPAQLYLALQ